MLVFFLLLILQNYNIFQIKIEMQKREGGGG